MKRKSWILIATGSLAALAVTTALAGCTSQKDGEGATGSAGSALGPGGGGGAGAPGFHEKDTSEVVEKAIENDPSAKIRLVRTATGHRTPHYVAPGVDIVLSFVPHATRWIVSGAAKRIAADKRTIVCLTTTDTLGVATTATSIQTACAAIDAGAPTYHDAARMGSWTRGITEDGRVLFTRDADPFKPVRYDALGKGCDAMALLEGRFVFLGESYCSTTTQPGAECEDYCFIGKGQVNADGFCQLPPDALPYCPSGLACTGDKDPAKRCR